MIAQLTIKDIETDTRIGIHPNERNRTQPVRVTLSVTFDAARAIQSDQIRDTIDYDPLAKMVKETVQETRCNLVETLAHIVLTRALGYPGIISARVEITKPTISTSAKVISLTLSARNVSENL